MKVLITCGPTWVALDDVRVISNQSSGEMGHLIAQEFNILGAKVTLIEGPVTHALNITGIKVIKYKFFDELENLLNLECKKNYDIIVHAAAVSDFKPRVAIKNKIDSSKAVTIDLLPTRKLINQIKRLAKNSFLVGFKLEPSYKIAQLNAITSKLFTEAQCDLVLCNSINPKYQSFIIDADGTVLAKDSTKAMTAKNLVRILN